MIPHRRNGFVLGVPYLCNKSLAQSNYFPVKGMSYSGDRPNFSKNFAPKERAYFMARSPLVNSHNRGVVGGRPSGLDPVNNL
mgnify:CR=1 FL=1